MSKEMEDLSNKEKKEIALKLLQDGNLQEEKSVKCFGFTLVQVEEMWYRRKCLK